MCGRRRSLDDEKRKKEEGSYGLQQLPFSHLYIHFRKCTIQLSNKSFMAQTKREPEELRFPQE
jgi:hypothetical protein